MTGEGRIDEVTLVCSGAYGANEDLVNRISEAQKQYAAACTSNAQPLKAAGSGSSIQLVLITAEPYTDRKHVWS